MNLALSILRSRDGALKRAEGPSQKSHISREDALREARGPKMGGRRLRERGGDCREQILVFMTGGACLVGKMRARGS